MHICDATENPQVCQVQLLLKVQLMWRHSSIGRCPILEVDDYSDHFGLIELCQMLLFKHCPCRLLYRLILPLRPCCSATACIYTRICVEFPPSVDNSRTGRRSTPSIHWTLGTWSFTQFPFPQRSSPSGNARRVRSFLRSSMPKCVEWSHGWRLRSNSFLWYSLFVLVPYIRMDHIEHISIPIMLVEEWKSVLLSELAGFADLVVPFRPLNFGNPKTFFSSAFHEAVGS